MLRIVSPYSQEEHAADSTGSLHRDRADDLILVEAENELYRTTAFGSSNASVDEIAAVAVQRLRDATF